MVTIGHASISENNTINGKKGDQTGKEVCTRNWYDKNWSYLIRPIDSKIAEKIAKGCELICKNDNVGYSQNDRNSLHEQAEKCSYNLAKIKTKCNCDCSSLVTVCCIYAGVKIKYGDNALTTSSLYSELSKTKQFNIITNKDYLATDKLLKRGDILVKPNSHTVIVLSDGKESTTMISYYPRYKGTTHSIVDALESMGIDSDFATRSTLAEHNGISNYNGSASQNLALLGLLKSGLLIRK